MAFGAMPWSCLDRVKTLTFNQGISASLNVCRERRAARSNNGKEELLIRLLIPMLLLAGCAASNESELDESDITPPPTNDAYCIQEFGVPCAELPD